MWCPQLFISGLVATATAAKTHIEYEVVTGIFKQDDPATVASGFNYTAENFGLIERKYPSDGSYPGGGYQYPTSWQRLNHYISTLNRSAKRSERYALLFLARHGEGYHNAAETYFGTPDWNCYWSEKDGNETVTWADAHLTVAGTTQAIIAHDFWKHLLTVQKIAPPQAYYTSPLTRCLATANLTFSGLSLPASAPFIPTVKENFREGISAHTCDRRSTKFYITASFPKFKFEPGFAEEDPYWHALRVEPSSAQDVRSKTVLDEVVGRGANTYVSVTTHSGEIASLLRVLRHRVFGLGTGQAIPVLVKVKAVQGDAPATSTQPWGSQKTCAAPPGIRDASCNDCSCCS